MTDSSGIFERHRKARILLADDNVFHRCLVTECLQLAGVSVDVACSGIEAIAMVPHGAYDLILMDILMPGMDGLQATQHVRMLPGMSNIPIIAMSSHSKAGHWSECEAAGMNDFIHKPAEPETVLSVLDRWIPSVSAPADSRALPAPTRLSMPTGLHALKGLDVTVGLRFFAGDVNAYINALRQFVSMYGVGMSWCQTHSVCGNSESEASLKREVHSLAGVCAMVGATILRAQAERLEMVMMELPQEDHANAVQELDCALVWFSGQLRDLLLASRCG